MICGAGAEGLSSLGVVGGGRGLRPFLDLRRELPKVDVRLWDDLEPPVGAQADDADSCQSSNVCPGSRSRGGARAAIHPQLQFFWNKNHQDVA